MILLWAVAGGLLAGLVRVWVNKYEFHPPALHLLWLVPVAYLPQFLAFNWHTTRELISDGMAAIILVGSQILLLVFALVNWNKPGFWALGLGLALNLLVIALNGGLMPISPETVSQLSPNAPPDSWRLNQRLWGGKDIVLPVEATHLWWLSDCLLLPTWMPDQVAFSIGDILIALGAFALMWASGGSVHQHTQPYK